MQQPEQLTPIDKRELGRKILAMDQETLSAFFLQLASEGYAYDVNGDPLAEQEATRILKVVR